MSHENPLSEDHQPKHPEEFPYKYHRPGLYIGGSDHLGEFEFSHIETATSVGVFYGSLPGANDGVINWAAVKVQPNLNEGRNQMTMPRNLMGDSHSGSPKKTYGKITSITVELDEEALIRLDTNPTDEIANIVTTVKAAFPGQIPDRTVSTHVSDNVFDRNRKVVIEFD